MTKARRRAAPFSFPSGVERVATRGEQEAEAQAHRETADALLAVRGLPIADVDLLTSALCRLTFRERHLVLLRSGVPKNHSYTLQELGNIFRITRERVRQILARSMHNFLADARVRAAWKRLERLLARRAKGQAAERSATPPAR